MNIAELRQMTAKKLGAELHKVRRNLASARFHAKTGQNKDTSQIKKLKKVVAQILLLLSQHNKKETK